MANERILVGTGNLVNFRLGTVDTLRRVSDTLRFPDGFLFGASISAYQTEGGNTNTDWWWWEHIAGTPCREPSGDACDFYHRYREDIAMLSGFGLNCFRFGIEWARIEPAEGEFSRAQLAHYRQMLDACHEHGVAPILTFHHFTVPRWLHEQGGIAADGAAAIRSRSGAPTGVTLALPDLQYEDGAKPGTSSLELESQINDWFFQLARQDDFVGVQTYTRFRYGPEGSRSPGSDWSDTTRELVETDQTTQMGYEYYPQALGGAIRRAHRSCPGVPILVTESGIATGNDEKRIHYIDTAMREVLACMAEGIDVRSYVYWSLLDNFEWALGYAPTFGLVAVDRETFARHPRPSAWWLGQVSKSGFTSPLAGEVGPRSGPGGDAGGWGRPAI